MEMPENVKYHGNVQRIIPWHIIQLFLMVSFMASVDAWLQSRSVCRWLFSKHLPGIKQWSTVRSGKRTLELPYPLSSEIGHFREQNRVIFIITLGQGHELGLFLGKWGLWQPRHRVQLWSLFTILSLTAKASVSWRWQRLWAWPFSTLAGWETSHWPFEFSKVMLT